MGRVLSVTLAYVEEQEREWGVENEPLFYGKELKALEDQGVFYDFKVCILSKPELTSCEMGLRVRGRGRRENETSTT